jgi:large subunit ribosomal protein L10
MRAAGGTVKVAKNRLAKIALQGTESGIADLFKGPTVIAYSRSGRGAEGRHRDFAKGNDKLVILGGSMGKTTLDADGRQGSRHPAVARRAARQARSWHAQDGRPGSPRSSMHPAAGQLARVFGAYAKEGRSGRGRSSS